MNQQYESPIQPNEKPRRRNELVMLLLTAALGAAAWTSADQLLWQRELDGDPSHALRWQALELGASWGVLSVLGAIAFGALRATQRATGIAASGARAVQLVFVPLLFVGALAEFEAGSGSAVRPLLGFALLALLALLWPVWIALHPPRTAARAALVALGSTAVAMLIAARPVLERGMPLEPAAFDAVLIAHVAIGLPLLVLLVRLAASRWPAWTLSCPVAIALVAAGWRLELPRATELRAPGPNVLLIYADTLRRDRVGLYDRERGQTPETDRFFERGVVLEDPISPSSWTLPALTAVFSQRLPALRLDLEKGDHVMTTETEMLAEALAERGYATAALTANPLIFGATGLLRGFEDAVSLHHLRRRDEPDRVPPLAGRILEFAGPKLARDRRYRDRNPELVERGLEWIDAQRERSFFLWLHFMSPHDPYDPPADLWDARGYAGQLPAEHYAPSHEGPSDVYLARGWTAFDAADREHVVRLYDAETRGLDRELGKLFAGLEARGALENTIVVLLSDHGEELWEHGAFYHGHTLHREVCDVPWLWRAPGLAARRVSGVVSTLDLVPTLKEMLGVPPEEGPVERDSASLLALLRGSSEERRNAFSCEHREHLYAVRDEEWCAIWNAFTGERRLYDRRADPLEQRNVASERPDLFERYLPQLEAIRKTARARAEREHRARAIESRSPASEIDARVKSIGY